MTIACLNPCDHAGCSHHGWSEVHPTTSKKHIEIINAARAAATWASQDLGLDTIRIRLFGPDPIASYDDKALVLLNAGFFDPGMMGKACHPEDTLLPTVWVRAGLSPCLTAAIVLHEARHIWQMTTNDTSSDDEADADEYTWRSVMRTGFFARGDVVRAFHESQPQTGETR